MQYAFGWTTSNAWIDEEMFEDATMRVYSTLGNPNVLGEYLLLVLPVAAVYMLEKQVERTFKMGVRINVPCACVVSGTYTVKRLLDRLYAERSYIRNIL